MTKPVSLGWRAIATTVVVAVSWIILPLLSTGALAAQPKAAPGIEQKIEAGGKGYIQTGAGKMVITHIQGIPPAEYAKIAGELGVTQAALKNFFGIVKQRQVPAEQLDATLRAMASQFTALRMELAAFQSEDPAVVNLKRAAAAALDKGDFSGAESALEQARTTDLEAAKRMKLASEQRLRSAAASANELGNLKHTQLAYADAARYYRDAADVLPAADEHERAEYLNSLGDAAYEAGLYPVAQKAHEEALALRKKALGPDHPDTATSLNNLALLYADQGRYAEAEPLHKESLVILKKVLGPEHPDTATSLNNLAALYTQQNRYTEAEPLYKESLAITKKALGPDHPDTATSLNNLAALYTEQGRYADAEPLYKESLAITKKALGPDHPDTAINLNNLAELYAAQGHYAQAEVLHKESLAITKKALGPDHPDTAISLNNLAELYVTQGRYAEAEPLYKESLAICKKALGPEHPSTATVRKNLLGLYREQGREAETKALEQETVLTRNR